MTINKRLKFGSATLTKLGLIPEGESYDSEKHRLKSITLYSDGVLPDEKVNEMVIYLGHNQVSDQTIMVLECGTELELNTICGTSRLIRVRKTGYVLNVDETIRDRNSRLTMFIPLRDPHLDGWRG